MRLSAPFSRLFTAGRNLLAALPLLAAIILTLPQKAAAQTVVSIHDIMVAGSNPIVGTATTKTLPYSPYYGTNVSVTAVVVGVMSTGDFAGTVYISEPSGNCSGSATYCWDSNVLTAEGMPVFNLKALNPACAVIGASITVVGPVVLSNSIVPADITAAGTPGTGINPTSCTVNSTGNTMTQSISVSSVLTAFGDALKYTGMTTTATFYAIAPTAATTNATSGAVTSTGQFWGTLSSNTHLFRSVGIAGDEYNPSTTAATWTGNPQRVLIDTTTFGGSPVDITVGQNISCTTGSNIKVGATAGIGLIDYTLGYARLLIFPTSVCSVQGTIQPTTSATADSTHFHVGTLDLNAFYNTTANYSTRLAKAAQAIVGPLGMPDIVGLQEVQDYATLNDLANAVNTLGKGSYAPYLTAGNDANNLNLGFLVNTSTVTVDSVTQVEKGATYTTTAGASATLWERPPLILKAEFVRIGKNYPFTVANVHLTPRDNIGDTTLGPDIRSHRASQATDLSTLVQSYQTAGQNMIVAGNFNAFEYSDGYVDVLGIVKGSPATAVALYKPTSTTAALTDFTTLVPAASRYNFIERGDAVAYEHILASATVPDPSTASASLASYETAVTQPHFTTDFAAATYAPLTTTPAGFTPHDGFVVDFLIPPVPTTAAVTPTTINFGDVNLGASSAQTITFTNTTTFTSTVTVSNIKITGTNASDFTQTSNCTSLAMGQSCTTTVTFAPTAIGSRTATITFTSDSTSEPTLSVSLIGNGTDTTATLTPTTATFPSTDIGATSAATVFTFTNTSAAVALTVGTPQITGDYAISANTCTASIAVGATCTLSVTFSPTTAGSRTGTLTVPNSSTGNPSLTAALGGTGLDTTATLTPTSATFPDTSISATSAPQTFTVTNTSTVAIKITAPTINGDYAVASSTCSGITLAAGATCTITVTFAPTAAGARPGVLTVSNTSTGNPTLTASLTGNGLNTTATLTPAIVTFASTDVTGTSASQTVTVTNTSAIAININITKANITGDFAQTATTCGATIAAGATCTYTLTFTPTAVGTRAGTLVVTNSTTSNPTLTATLSGTGLDTTATLAPNTTDFGSIYAGGGLSAAKSFTVTNTSAIAITVKTVTIAGNFTQTNTCGATLAAGATCTVSVVFAPLASGALTGTLTVTDSTTANPILTAALTGTGLPTTATFTPTAATYVNTIVGSTSAAQVFIWTNTSAIPLTISKVSTTGNFTVSATTCTGTVAANASCTVSVTFTPLALGPLTGSVSVASSSSANPVLTSTLNGRGVADVEASVDSLSYGNVDLGFSAAPQTFTVTNYTAASIALTSITISGDYAYTTTCGATLAGQSTCTVTVTFKPTALGVRTGSLTVNTNDTKYPIITVALTGSGVDFALSIAPSSGNVIAGRAVYPFLTLTPLGGFSSAVTISCTTDAGGSACTAANNPVTLTTAQIDPMTITTTSQYTVIGYGALGARNHPWMTLLALLSAGAIAFRLRRSRTLPRLTLAAVALFVFGFANLGCGNKLPDRNPGPTYPGSYTYTISATDGNVTRTATYTLNVTVR